jgi:hypothetical protein
VARISYGLLEDGRVRIEAVQDVFALSSAIYATPPATAWTNPVNLPAPCPAQLLYEVPYWQVVKDMVGEWPSLLSDIDPTEGWVASLGARPSSDAIDYHAFAYDGSQWQDKGRGSFAPTGQLLAALPQSVTTTPVTLTAPLNLSQVSVGDFALIDDEWLLVTAVNAAGNQVTLARGVLDTVPAAHSAGARVWFVAPHYIQPEYTSGQTAQVRLCPKTGRGELAVTAASTISRTIQQRFIRPYPPGKIQLNSQYYPVAVAGDVTVTWANRNRVTQTAQVILQTDNNITPETGQTTTIRFYDSGNTLRRTYSGLTGTSQTWTLAQIAADGAASSNSLRIEVESSRTDANGTFVSLYKHNITVQRAGYGLNYGNFYGGA